MKYRVCAVPRAMVCLTEIRLAASARLLAMVLFSLALPAGAQTAATGTIEGRVINSRTGEYLENVRISIEGVSLEIFTDSDGGYRLYDVPAGRITVRASYTGVPPQIAEITVAAGQTLQRDFDLAGAPGKPGTDPSVIKLSEFVVSTSRQMDAAALAINEQRYSPNIKTVIAADEFGAVVENDIGEVLKFVPGITMDYNAGDARRVSMDGVSSDYLPVTVGGFNLANANQGGTNRAAALDQVSLNNISRVEVIQSPTPESPGSALAGSINLVPRSAFERSRPLLQFSTFLAMRDNARDFHKSVGPRSKPTRKVLPGFDFAYVAPVNDRFGYSLSGSASQSYSPRDYLTNTWRGANAATNGGTLPDTTPDQPYLSGYLYRDGFILRTRTSVGLTLDYKLSSRDRVSFSLQRTGYATDFDNRILNFISNRVAPGSFTLTSMHGFAGAGELRVTNQTRSRNAWTFMPTLVYRHHGPIWTAQAGAGYSKAVDGFHDVAKGYFSQTIARRTNVTVRFDDITPLRPGRITVTDGTTGAVVNPYDIRTYALTAPQSQHTYSSDMQRSANANLARGFRWHGNPGTVKVGVEVANSVRDIRSNPLVMAYVGADGVASTTLSATSDDLAAPFCDAAIANRPAPFGFPAAPVVSHQLLWQHYLANPREFTLNENTTYVNAVTGSRRAEEWISSAYVRTDLALFKQRLRLVGGVRAEQTNVNAEGPLNDPSRNYQRDAAGKIVLGANGRPVSITTNTLAASRLTRLDRGARVSKEYLRWFPSLNASYNLRENLIARGAYYHSIGRPNFNRYAGGITLPDPDATTVQRITVNNAGLKPWTARTVKLSLEYYLPGVGLISLGGFRRDFDHFFATTVFPATTEFLALYGLDAATYGSYLVSTQYNTTESVRMEGLTLNYKQALTFLPSWARGFQVYANGNSQRATGGAAGEFTYSPRFGNWGLSFTRAKTDLRINWNYRGRQRGNAVTDAGIGPGTFNWNPARTYIDLSGEYAAWKRFSLFAKIRNLRDQTEDSETSGPATPAIARLTDREDFAALWTIGIKGKF